MTDTKRGVVGVTGASGYLGSRICSVLEREGWSVIRLVRSPAPGDSTARRLDLRAPIPPEGLASIDVLIHTAYDFSLTRRQDIWKVNVEGTRRLLSAARAAGVPRIVVLSTMSAYPGTGQLYGQAKLAIEAETLAAGGCVIRPGLVYGQGAAGMAGALLKATRLPVVPLIAGSARQFPVHIDDLLAAIAALASTPDPPSAPVGVANPQPVTFKVLLETLAAQEGRRCRFVPIPWQILYAMLRAGELLRLSLPFRADSLLGLVRPAPFVPHPEELERLGVVMRPFAATSPVPNANGRTTAP